MQYKEKAGKFTALRMIRIVKNMKAKDFADIFAVSTSYIHAVEVGEKEMNQAILEVGLNKLGIDIKRYEELEKTIFKLSKLNLVYEDMNMACLAAAIKTVNPSLESSVNTVIYSLKRRAKAPCDENNKQDIKTR